MSLMFLSKVRNKAKKSNQLFLLLLADVGKLVSCKMGSYETNITIISTGNFICEKLEDFYNSS